MKQLLIITALLCMALTASADDYGYLTLEQQDGTKTSITATGLTITFTGGNLVATNGSENATIALSSLSKMSFTATNQGGDTAISSIQLDDISLSDADAIYDLSGRQIPSGATLQKGVYIIKKENQTRKIQVR